MQTLENIRAFYQPIQPTTQVKNSEILYQEILPTEALQSYIHCFWRKHPTIPLLRWHPEMR